jgi:hypothetical protein
MGQIAQRKDEDGDAKGLGGIQRESNSRVAWSHCRDTSSFVAGSRGEDTARPYLLRDLQ